MPRVTDADITRMRDQLFEGPEERRRLSRFRVLLVLAAIIAAAGVVADSTATVIGALIVAPLTLRAALDASGMADLSVDLELVPGNVVELPGS